MLRLRVPFALTALLLVTVSSASAGTVDLGAARPHE